MANITSTVATPFLPTIWAQRALSVLRTNIVLAKLCARDVDYAPGWVGEQLNIPYPGTFVASDKVANTLVGISTPTGGTTVNVTLNKHKTVDMIIEDYANAQANENLMDRYVVPAAIALAQQLETDLLSNYANLTNTVGTSGTNVTAATVQAALENLDINLAPMSDRALIVSPKDKISLLQDSTLQTYFAFSEQNAIREGAIGNLFGFDTYMSQLIPVVTGTPNSTKCLAIHKESILLAMRPFREPPADSGVKVSSLVDPVSGLAIRVLYQYDINNRGIHLAFDMLYGTVALRPTVGCVVLS